MTWTTPSTPVAGSAITVAFYNTNIRDNLNHLRGMVPDAGAANQVLNSSSTTGASWTASPTISGSVSIGTLAITSGNLSLGSTRIISFTAEAAEKIQLDSSAYSIGTAANTVYIRTPAVVELRDSGGTPRISFDVDSSPSMTIGGSTVWHTGNDGAGSGLDADTVDGIQGAAIALLAGATFTGGLSASAGLSATTGTFSDNVTAIGKTIAADRFSISGLAGSEFLQASAASEVGVYVGGLPRYKQTATAATFTTPGTYATSWTASSDRRLKSNIEPVLGALELLLKLEPVTFTQSPTHRRVFGAHDDRRRHGLIAQDVRTVLPDLVEGTESDDEFLSLDYARLSVLNTAAIQELAARIKALGDYRG